MRLPSGVRNETIASFLVVAILAGAGTGYFVGVYSGGKSALASVTGPSSTLGAIEPCAEAAGDSGGIGLQVTNGSMPVANATVTVEVIGSCQGSGPVLLTRYDATTDSSGWVYMCVNYNGVCSFTVNLVGHQYPISVPLFPGGGSIVHYDVWNNSETVTPVPGTTTTRTTMSCTISAEGFLIMKVLNSSNNRPIGSLPVRVEGQYPACLASPAYDTDLGTYETNASGILSLSGTYNWFYLSVSFGREVISVNATVTAGALTCVTFSIPSGNLDVTQHCDPSRYFAP